MRKVSAGADWADLAFLTTSALCSLMKLLFLLGSLSVYREVSGLEGSKSIQDVPEYWRIEHTVSSQFTNCYEAIAQIKLNLVPQVTTLLYSTLHHYLI